MNWQEIASICPQSFDRLCNRWGDLELNEKGILFSPYSVDMHFNERELYDFFDAEGIYISIICRGSGIAWTWQISICNELTLPADHLATRTEAEEQAFTKAFEILEQKLKEGR